MALAIYTLLQKKCSAFGAITLGLGVFIGLYLLDALALNRIGMEGARKTGIDLASELHRLLHGGEEIRMQMLFNVVAFVPFGFFLAEFLTSLKRFNSGRRIGLVFVASLGLSLFIECIQLAFRVGLFELTDLLLNTAGAIIGAVLSMVIHGIIEFFAKTKAYGR